MGFSTKSLNFKIVLYTVLCVFVVGGLGNLYVYTYMNRIVEDKVAQIGEMQLRTMKLQADNSFEELLGLGIVCSSDRKVQTAMKYRDLSTQAAAKNSLAAQTVLNTSLSTVSVHPYVTKLFAFNTHGLMVHAGNVRSGDLTDVKTLMESPLFVNRGQTAQNPQFVLTRSITPYAGQCFAALFPIKMANSSTEAYLYIETFTDIVSNILKPHDQLNHLFFSDTAGGYTVVANRADSEIVGQMGAALAQRLPSVLLNGVTYKLTQMELDGADAVIWSFADMNGLLLGQWEMLYTLGIVLLTTLFIVLLLSFFGTRYITRPVSRLIYRLHRIAENDFSFDPSIERSQDEIGQIGHVVNEMTMSVSRLLEDSIAAATEKKNIEIALLQAQVNPHFLYNTLDSVYWMATVSKNTGICKITRSLSNLLRNMSKGIGNKIPLREELSLLEDYVAIQSARFCGVFLFQMDIPEGLLDYTIIKMTLQPIVENAIIHGIGDAEQMGMITLKASADEKNVYLVVEDNGVGMTQEQAQALLHTKQARGRDSLSGIGVENVHRRLRLVYGAEYGLSVESCLGAYTRVTVTIPKEEQPNVSNTAGG